MLKIKISFIAVCVFVSATLFAQGKLMVEGASPNLHLVHTVAPKENWYSIGRIYNQSPKEIAPFNGTSIDKPLAIGQKIKIPLTDMNFSQDGARAGDEVFVPLYHTVQDKEWMYRISTTHNKVPVENLQKWNNVKNDQLKAGMQVIVGYLKVKTAQSPLAARGSQKIQIAAAPPVAMKETPAEEVVAKDPPAREETAKTTPATPVTKQPETTEAPRPAETQPVLTSNGPASHKGGAFRKLYEENGNGTAGNAGIFRSTSGWNDGKYYALMNNVPVGTIVKVSFSSTNKSVYAKVLGQLPEMRESAGLTIRISDAAASELGVSMNKFYVDVKY
jgi:LysM repeat protein